MDGHDQVDYGMILFANISDESLLRISKLRKLINPSLSQSRRQFLIVAIHREKNNIIKGLFMLTCFLPHIVWKSFLGC